MRLAIFAIAAALLLCAAPSFAAVDDVYSVNLLHFDGNITDESGTAWSATGAVASTTQYKFGTSSLYGDGNDYISADDSDDWAFDAGSFTVDAWVHMSSDAGGEYRFMSTQAGSAGTFFRIRERHLEFECNRSAVRITDSATFPTGQWVHVAISRDGDDWRLFRGGEIVASASDSTSVENVSAVRAIGGEPNWGLGFPGYIDEFRVSKGVARWTNTFTPPTAAYGSTPAPAITSPLYICSDGSLRFADGGRFYFK